MQSTPVQAAAHYYEARGTTRWLRWAMRALQSLWPALAVRVALRLFCTPLPPKWLRRQGALDSRWQPAHWPFEGVSLTLYSPSSPGLETVPAVLLCHGWAGHAGQMLPLAAQLAAQGLRPLLLEMPAHGRSAGGSTNLPQFIRAIEYVAARMQQAGTPLHAVVAHSMAANAAAFAAARGLPVDRLVLLAPPASPLAFTRLFAQAFGLQEKTRTALQGRLEGQEGLLMAQLEPPMVGARVRAATLVVHDREDRVNRFADGLAYSQHIPHARLVATEGLGHLRMLKAPQVMAEVAAFVAV